MEPMLLHWDIFCRVVDNYGDIGVCWRLARQLRAEHGRIIRLWVDDLGALASMCPLVDTGQDEQVVDGIQVRRWGNSFQPVEAAEVVIEAFACDLPAIYLAAMASNRPTPYWINLEYLSAEPWVEGCHCLASPHPSLPLTKHFFFPGFTSDTGGLLREAGLFERQEKFSCPMPQKDCLEVSLFCYETAPVRELLDIWANGNGLVRCLVPPGKPLLAVQSCLQGKGPWRMGNLEVTPIPFLTQDKFDQLLWKCDINFIRGEDSFVRAQWARKPFVWQIYPQDEGAHLIKLEAFLGRYTEKLPALVADSVRNLTFAWNTGGGLAVPWENYLNNLDLLSLHGKMWATSLADRADLVSNLVKFCDAKL